jgi:predicted metal-dependent phosphoesterase TrpH
MDGKADLHIHTLYSDGALSPAEVVQAAYTAGLSTISITDHDSVSALEEATELGRTLGVEVIPGVELSAAVDDTEIHILGYFFDFQNEVLLESLAEFREERLRRAERIVNKLNSMNIPLSMESVLANVTGESVGRPHIATALVNGGHAHSYHQAFSKYIGDGRPAYERKSTFTPVDTVRLIAGAGGLSFLAHPGRMVSEEMLIALLKSGLDGIEVVHPSHTPDLVRYYRGIVNELFLLESGGSDFHGGLKGDEHLLGQVAIPAPVVDAMRHRLSTH